MRNIVLKLLLILAILAACFYFVYPPQEKVRLGKDLRGGVSLIYSVQMGDVRDRQAVLQQTIQVLQDRINPQGVLDISMEPVGDDRIEVVMPSPSPEVLQLRETFERELENLLDEAQIPPGRLDNALRFNQAPQQFGGDPDTERGRLVADLQQAYNDLQEAREQLDQLGPDADAVEVARMEQAVADAMIEHEDLRDQVLRLSLDRPRVIRVIGLPTAREVVRGPDRRPLINPDTGEQIYQPSQRDVELNNLKSEFPQLADALDRTVAASDAYQARRTGFDDPEDLKRLLRGAGVLEFRIAVRPGAEDVNIADLTEQLAERGPENIDSPMARWFEVNDLRQWYDTAEDLEFLQADPTTFFAQARQLVAAERDGHYYLLLYTSVNKSMTHEGDRRWSVQRASRDIDQQGRPSVAFELDSTGGNLMNRMTGPQVGEPMAIVLDGQVYSAPTLQSQIGSRGVITGVFTSADISYLIRVLAAGALEARLSENPIAQNNLGPSLGADNLQRGLEAFAVALIAIGVFMIAYYFFAGLVAVIALMANGLIIFGVMSAIDGTFTMPGLAGIVLTIGMAVDANVLIYERIREEIFAGEYDLRGAVRQGFAKALSTILDANITNLIVCLVLFQTATAEVRGFALTLTIGIASTLFTCLFVTRVIYTLYTEVFKAKSLPMLPTVVPSIHHTLEPNINWVALRKFGWALSAVAVVASIGLVSSRGADLFDTELRGGVAVTLRTALLDEDASTSGERLWLPHVGPGSVEAMVQEIAEDAGDPATATTDEQRTRIAVLQEFRNASVLTVGQTRMGDRGVEGQSFQIKVPNPTGIADDAVTTDEIVRAVVAKFEDQLDVTPPLTFRGEDSGDHAEYTYPIETDELGANFGQPQYTDRVTDYLGGVIVLIEDIEPAVTVDEVRTRLERMRGQPDFGAARGRDFEVFGLQPADMNNPRGGYESVAVAVYDPSFSYMRVDFGVWDRELAQVEWSLAAEALSRPPSLEQVASFSAAMARSLAAAAQVAVIVSLLGILLYIWIRFGSLRYSMAAIVALVHDVTIALGILALTAYVGRTAFGSMLLIEEFRIDMGVVAALLTIIGYSLNDTIVILDRIRENRGKLPNPSAAIVNRSINQTFSRTVITSFTTLLAIVIMYIEGGSGIRAFAFCLMIGLVVGTYSSVAIAAPLVFDRNADRKRAADTLDVPERDQRPELAAE